jgi:peptide chain release factor subunit 1
MAQHKPTGQGMILFCSGEDGLFWWRDVKVLGPNEVRWSRRPHIRPLLELQDEFERYCIILSDREQGHLFTVFMGEIEQHLELASSAEVKHSKKPGSDHIRSQMQFQRKADLHALWHLKKVVKLAERQMSLCPYERLIVAGPAETTGVLHRLLPKRLKDRVVASIALPVQAAPQEILEATLKIEQRVEREAEVKLVGDLVVAASKSMRAVTGLAATVLAFNNAELWKLVYAQESSVPGKRCALCDRLYGVDRFSCGHCNKPLQPVDDLIEIIAERLIRLGRRVEQVRGEASQHLMQAGGIGGFLRLRGRRPGQSATRPVRASARGSAAVHA